MRKRLRGCHVQGRSCVAFVLLLTTKQPKAARAPINGSQFIVPAHPLAKITRCSSSSPIFSSSSASSLANPVASANASL